MVSAGKKKPAVVWLIAGNRVIVGHLLDVLQLAEYYDLGFVTSLGDWHPGQQLPQP